MLLGFRRLRPPSTEDAIRHGITGVQLVKTLLLLFLILAIHTFAMIHFEKMALGDAIWLTMTSATTVGYGDLSAKTFAGRSATILLLYLGGIAILAQVVAMYFEYRASIRENILKGKWSWKMKNHIVFLNAPQKNSEDFFYKAISGMRASNSEFANLPVVIVSEYFKDGISQSLRKLNIVHVNRSIFDEEAFSSSSIQDANTVVILSKDHQDPSSDGVSFELVDRLRQSGFLGRIVVEAIKDENRARLKRIGANNVLRPVRTYPEILVRSILAPGSEAIIETLFNSSGEECIRFDLEIEISWLEIIKKLAESDVGTPIAYEDFSGIVHNNPSSKEKVRARALFIIVSKEKNLHCQDIAKILY
jgi:voltage-gated potassium channel